MGDDSGNLVEFIWSICDLLRGDFKSADYGHVILPFTVLRRLDCLLDQTRGRVQEALEQLTYSDMDREERLTAASGHAFDGPPRHPPGPSVALISLDYS